MPEQRPRFAAEAGPEDGLRGRVLLGVTGGIAACKAPQLVRRLREQGFDVCCALTAAAEQFVAPLALEVLSGRPVFREEYLSPGGGDGRELHVELARWADVLCIAPATAHTLSRLAWGLADDFLTTTALVHAGPLVLAPAMHSVMWHKPSVHEAVTRLVERGATLVGPEHGALASGEVGDGRMSEPEAIAAAVVARRTTQDLAGQRWLVSAGPTHEPIDPVRYLGNRSSGKMGFALAAEAAARGARVVLVAGPVALSTPPGVERVDVESGAEMASAVAGHAVTSDVIVMAAAVADYRPAERSPTKIKRQGAEGRELRLVANPDILAGLATRAPAALRVGFAAETDRVREHGERKLESKGVDLLVVNDVSRRDIGFGSDDNEVLVLRPGRAPVELGKRHKRLLAAALVDLIRDARAERAVAGGSSPSRA
jgi:phosphopantothenoylcysteine decarboxylase/phosphopantothenate--cysteine ligase